MEEFDIDKDSETLKELVSIYDPVIFLAEITELLKLDGFGRIPYRPFVSMDSPLKQLTYLAQLNLSSETSKIKSQNAPTPEEWNDIMEYSVRVKAGYHDALLPTKEDDEEEFKELYGLAMPVFFDFHDTGTINYEEQEIARIEGLFAPYTELIEEKTGLSVEDYISAYDFIGDKIQEKFNEPLKLLRADKELRELKDQMVKEQKAPSEWNYSGTNGSIKQFIALMTDRVERNLLSISLAEGDSISEEKLECFLKIFSSARAKSEFQYYTEPNDVLMKPIYRTGESDILIISHKQLIHAIYKTLLKIVTSSKAAEKFYTFRGKYLQNQTLDLFKKFFKDEGYYYNEYKVDGNGQDILIMYGSVAFIIENKAGKEVELSKIPNVKHLYLQYLKTFKKNIDEGYEQCFRVREKFIDKEVLSIHDESDKHLWDQRTKKFRNSFSIIVTQDRFRNPQVNLPMLLELYEDDDWPLSICIDDLEVLLLTLIKLRITPAQFERMLIQRQKLQGRVNSTDELEIWSHLIFNKGFKIPDDESMHFSPGLAYIHKFDELYNEGLGFENERNLEKKQSTEWKTFMGFNAPF